jgi:hypothetical protein
MGTEPERHYCVGDSVAPGSEPQWQIESGNTGLLLVTPHVNPRSVMQTE